MHTTPLSSRKLMYDRSETLDLMTRRDGVMGQKNWWGWLGRNRPFFPSPRNKGVVNGKTLKPLGYDVDITSSLLPLSGCLYIPQLFSWSPRSTQLHTSHPSKPTYYKHQRSQVQHQHLTHLRNGFDQVCIPVVIPQLGRPLIRFQERRSVSHGERPRHWSHRPEGRKQG